MMLRRHWMALSICLWASPAAAAAPALVPVEGYLSDAVGGPVEGAADLTFRLYADPSGGTPLYEETQSVILTSGLFSVHLGSVTALDLNLFAVHGDLNLAIQVGADVEMTPRFPIATVPWAAHAQYAGNAETLQGAPASAFRLISDTIPLSEVSAAPSWLTDGDDDTLADLGACSDGSVARYIAGSWQCAPDDPGPGLPPGMMVFFDLDSCPSGWSDYAGAQGRTVVALPAGGMAEGTVGAALDDLENRSHAHSVGLGPTGYGHPQHEHTYSVAPLDTSTSTAVHTHMWSRFNTSTNRWSTFDDFGTEFDMPRGDSNGAGNEGDGYYPFSLRDTAATTPYYTDCPGTSHHHQMRFGGCTSSSAGAPAHSTSATVAVNAETTDSSTPYVQLLACVKN